LDGPALGLALAIVDGIAGTSLSRRGRILVLEDAAAVLGRAVMPAVGARAPRAEGLAASLLEGDGDFVSAAFDTALSPAALPAEVVRAVELGELVVSADDALVSGDPEAARAGYLVALERAPRHPELCRLV